MDCNGTIYPKIGLYNLKPGSPIRLRRSYSVLRWIRANAKDSLIGIIPTTGSFAKTARREAIKEGEASIVMIDGLTMMEKLRQFGWGIKTRGDIVEVDTYYFDRYHLFY